MDHHRLPPRRHHLRAGLRGKHNAAANRDPCAAVRPAGQRLHPEQRPKPIRGTSSPPERQSSKQLTSQDLCEQIQPLFHGRLGGKRFQRDLPTPRFPVFQWLSELGSSSEPGAFNLLHFVCFLACRLAKHCVQDDAAHRRNNITQRNAVKSKPFGPGCLSALVCHPL